MGSTVEENKALVQRFVAALNAREFNHLDELVAPDFIRHCQATPGVEVRSFEQFKDFQRQDAATFPDSQQTLKHLVAEGNLVAAWASYEGTQMGPMGPFAPSGRKMQVDFAAVFRVENGKLAELWVTWDNLAVLTQLGHLPPSSGNKD
jgi:predicted ester cyclase